MQLRVLGPATIQRKLSALSSLFDYLCERNAVLGNPVDGVKRPATKQ
jgi:site-specific recombinase XerC